MLARRETIEEREAATLAPYAQRSRDSRGRDYPEPEHPYRTAYQRDRDRIIHCGAFRRLEYKTQVFVNHEGDHFRTRLTHTMEVAQIARTLARALNVNEDLTEAIALAHDLGHTPFGHSGEDALRELMHDHGGFEHNIHGLRVVEVLERRYPDFPGLNLTWEVREAIAKHSTRYDSPETQRFAPHLRPSVEAQIVEIADSIAYDSHDLDDGLYAGLLTEEGLREVPFLAELLDRVSSRWPEADGKMRRSQLVRALIDAEATDLIETTAAHLAALAPCSADEVRRANHNVVAFSPQMEARRREVEDYLMRHVYRHYRVMRMASKARRFVEELFCAYVKEPAQLPPEYQARLAHESRERVVCDYIAGMTDRYAMDEYLKLFAPYERV